MIDPTAKELLAEESNEFKTIKKLVEEICDLGKLEKAYEIFGGYVNRSFGAEMIGKDGQPIDYFVRRYRSSQSEHDIVAEHELITYCIEKGLDIAAGLTRMPDGKTYTKIYDEKKGKEYPWAVYRYLYGEDLYDWLNNNMNPKEDASMGKVLAQLHSSAYGFQGGEKEESQIYEFLSVRKDHFVHCPDGLPIPERDRYMILYRDSVDYVLQMCDKAKKGMEDAGFVGKGIKTVCHCDYHCSNVKWKDHEVCGIFDFDWSKVDYRLFDISFCLVYICTAWEALQDGILHLDRAEYFLKAYNDHTKALGILPGFTEEEKKAFPYMYLAATIYLFNWATDYFNFWEDYNEYEWYYYLAHIMKAMHFAEDHLDDLYEIIARV